MAYGYRHERVSSEPTVSIRIEESGSELPTIKKTTIPSFRYAELLEAEKAFEFCLEKLQHFLKLDLADGPGIREAMVLFDKKIMVLNKLASKARMASELEKHIAVLTAELSAKSLGLEELERKYKPLAKEHAIVVERIKSLQIELDKNKTEYLQAKAKWDAFDHEGLLARQKQHLAVLDERIAALEKTSAEKTAVYQAKAELYKTHESSLLAKLAAKNEEITALRHTIREKDEEYKAKDQHHLANEAEFKAELTAKSKAIAALQDALAKKEEAERVKVKHYEVVDIVTTAQDITVQQQAAELRALHEENTALKAQLATSSGPAMMGALHSHSALLSSQQELLNRINYQYNQLLHQHGALMASLSHSSAPSFYPHAGVPVMPFSTAAASAHPSSGVEPTGAEPAV